MVEVKTIRNEFEKWVNKQAIKYKLAPDDIVKIVREYIS